MEKLRKACVALHVALKSYVLTRISTRPQTKIYKLKEPRLSQFLHYCFQMSFSHPSKVVYVFEPNFLKNIFSTSDLLPW